MHRQHITEFNKGKPQFILALDSAYYNIDRVFLQQSQRSAFSQPINYFPHEFFLNSAQSYLTIREREYLDESTSYIVDAIHVEPQFVLNAKGEKKQGDPRYKQLLPYLIARQLQDDGAYLYFPYRRTKKVGESRLAGNGSLGYGGHIDLEDVVSSKSVIDLEATILKSAAREAVEEFTAWADATTGSVILDRDTYDQYISFGDLFIVDNTNDVGELHLGIVMYFDVPRGYHLEASEDELAKLPPMTAEQMLTDPAFNPENWTRIYLNYITIENTRQTVLDHFVGQAPAETKELTRDVVEKFLGIDHGGVQVGTVDAKILDSMRTNLMVGEKMAELRADIDSGKLDMSAWVNHIAVSEKEALNLGRGGIYSPEGVTAPFADIQNQAAKAYHAAKEKQNEIKVADDGAAY